MKKINKIVELNKEFLKEEKVELPTDKVKNITNKLLKILTSKNIFPEKIQTSIEGGICLTFEKVPNRLFLEIYNDGDMGFIIEDTFHKKLLENEDLFSLSEASKKIENFMEAD